MTDLNKIPPTALAAAMKTGTALWGTHGSASKHARYAVLAPPKSRKKCRCGCNNRATHRGMANGVCLTSGCALVIYRWVKTGSRR